MVKKEIEIHNKNNNIITSNNLENSVIDLNKTEINDDIDLITNPGSEEELQIDNTK